MKKSAVFHQMNQPPRWWCSTPEQSARLSLPAIHSRPTRPMRSRGVSVADLIDKRSGVKLSCEIAPSWLALNCMGVRICLGQLKSYACDYLERVSRGETLEIVRRGRLVAFMVPPFPLLHEPLTGGDRIGAADSPATDANIPLSHLRKNAAPYFDRVAAGDIIGVVRRGRLVARIVAAISIL
jgi:antitoxin (DNA-binding transcriptional repressor) of toxin-antitoxin stability system